MNEAPAPFRRTRRCSPMVAPGSCGTCDVTSVVFFLPRKYVDYVKWIMTTLSHLRKTARSLPGSIEQNEDAGAVAYSTDDKRFAAATVEWVDLHLPGNDVEKVLAAHPNAERLPGKGVRVLLDEINGQQLNHWLRRAWRQSAPGLLPALSPVSLTPPGGTGRICI